MSEHSKAVLAVPLDDDSVERLMSLSRECGLPIADLAASLLHDLLEEDEGTHLLTAARPLTNTLN